MAVLMAAWKDLKDEWMADWKALWKVAKKGDVLADESAEKTGSIQKVAWSVVSMVHAMVEK